MRVLTGTICSLLLGLGMATASGATAADATNAPTPTLSMYTFQGSAQFAVHAYTGPCPVVLNFQGSISSTGPGVVPYVWFLSHNQPNTPAPWTSSALSATVTANQTKRVSYAYTFTKSMPSGFFALHSSLPGTMDAQTPSFSVTCT